MIERKFPHSMTPELKTIPGAQYRGGTWFLPDTHQTHVALGLDEADQLVEKQERHRNNEAPIKGHEHLYPFQAAGVRFMAAGKGVLNADEMGTGKTVQTLTAIDKMGAYPALVVAPKALLHNWAREVQQWTDATFMVIEGSAAQRRKQIEIIHAYIEDGADIVAIINYESLWRHHSEASFGNKALTDREKEAKELDIQWSSAVVDEAHRIKSPKAHATRASWAIRAEFRYALTGTPIVNDPDDLWSILRFVAPDDYPSRSRFRDRYCLVRPGFHGGLENLGLRSDTREEFDRLTQPRIIRRTKAEVLPQLPEKILTNVYLPMEDKQRVAYNQMVDTMLAAVDGGTLFATDPLTLVGRLRYLASGIPEVNDEGNVILMSPPSNKLAYIKSLLEDTDEPLVVYAASRKLIEMFERELDDHVSIHGNVTAAQRQVAIDRFMGGDAQILLATTGAGAEGLTLTRANRLVVAMEDWSNVKNRQAHDRIHRIGQERGVEIITLITEDTIEEAVNRATDRKEALLQQLVQDEEALMRAARGQHGDS